MLGKAAPKEAPRKRTAELIKKVADGESASPKDIKQDAELKEATAQGLAKQNAMEWEAEMKAAKGRTAQHRERGEAAETQQAPRV